MSVWSPVVAKRTVHFQVGWLVVTSSNLTVDDRGKLRATPRVVFVAVGQVRSPSTRPRMGDVEQSLDLFCAGGVRQIFTVMMLSVLTYRRQCPTWQIVEPSFFSPEAGAGLVELNPVKE